MFKRLFVLMLLVAATVSVSTPAHASTLTFHSLDCRVLPSPSPYAGYYACDAYVSGGTGIYSFEWTVTNFWQGLSYTYFTETGHLEDQCLYDPDAGYAFMAVQVVVRDTAGQKTGGQTYTSCYQM